MYIVLKAEMAKRNIKNKDMARLLNMCESSLSARIKGKRSFTYEDAMLIKNTYFSDCPIEYVFSKELMFEMRGDKVKGEG